MLPQLRTRKLIQNSWVVDDLEQSMAAWAAATGIGPFFVVDPVRVAEPQYRGTPTELQCRVALAQAGDIQIELVVQDNDVPSVYRDLVPAGRSGFHHVGIWCDDYERDLRAFQEQGFPVAYSGMTNGKRFCYVDTSALIGCMVELLEDCPRRRAFFDRIAEAACHWNGTDPVRPAF